MKRIITLQLDVEVPATITENEVERSINAALDEEYCNWGDWIVGPAKIVNVVKTK